MNPNILFAHLGTTVLADAWCKVRAMNQANNDFPDVKLFIYMDSDAVVDKAYVNVSVVSKVAEIQQLLQVVTLPFFFSFPISKLSTS